MLRLIKVLLAAIEIYFLSINDQIWQLNRVWHLRLLTFVHPRCHVMLWLLPLYHEVARRIHRNVTILLGRLDNLVGAGVGDKNVVDLLDIDIDEDMVCVDATMLPVLLLASIARWNPLVIIACCLLHLSLVG